MSKTTLPWRGLAKSGLALVDRLLWPARCVACQAVVGECDAFCAACELSVVAIGVACAGCAMPWLGEGAHERCPRCRSMPFAFSEARAALAYGGRLADALVAMKHAGRASALRPLGRLLAPALGAAAEEAEAFVPVPLHPRRLRARGFNQALELLREARRQGLAGGAPVLVDALVREHDTGALGHEPPRVRAERVRGAFVVPAPGRVRGLRVLVVDDVMTTGATLDECARTLLEAGANDVRVVALARAT
jgi:ComF family protein